MILFYRFLPVLLPLFISACSGSDSLTPGASGGNSSAILAQDNGALETCYNVRISYSGSNQSQVVCTTRENGKYNGLGVSRFMRFSLSGNSNVVIQASRISGLDPADPDLYVFRNGQIVSQSEQAIYNTETLSTSLSAGAYVVELNEYVYSYTGNKPVASISNGSGQQKTGAALSQGKTDSTCDRSSEGTVSGSLSFERVPHAGTTLDYNNIVALPIQQAVVEVICNNGIYSTTRSAADGSYSLLFPLNQASFVRVKAQMLQTGSPSWDFSIVDNTTTGKPLYVMDSAPFTASTDQTGKNLLADSGWTGNGYGSTRVAAPFAILDTVRKAMDKVLQAAPTVNFPPLKLNWSINNSTVAAGDLTLGELESSFFNGTEIYLLGKENDDTDEYDEHVIAHEWGHYFEKNFSRSDSIGGPHTIQDILDIRVAFGEGFGNAFSGIALDDPFYIDTSGFRQGRGFSMNIESNNCTNAGWYNECSVQSILYDIYDTGSNESTDNIALGFAPIYAVLTGAQKNTAALTSLFSFIKPLKDQNPANISDIDALTTGQAIQPVLDIYGASETSNNGLGQTSQLPVYFLY